MEPDESRNADNFPPPDCCRCGGKTIFHASIVDPKREVTLFVLYRCETCDDEQWLPVANTE
jgi:hypothetical protein